MKILFILNYGILFFLCCTSTFSQENYRLSFQDIIGTFQLDRIEELWHVDSNKKEEQLKWFDDFKNLIITKEYYILGHFKHKTTFKIVEIGEEFVVPLNTKRGGLTVSESYELFPEYNRQFNSVIVCDGYIWVIEVFNYNTLVIYFNNAFLLFKRVN